MKWKSKKREKYYVGMYKNYTDTTDIVSCYFSALNQMKGCSYTGQCNDIDMYSDLSGLEYKANITYENQ
ncbi:hypothetical protein [Romboutsia lituseburensis]|uniref:Uncharacterized protein n=1 Tax=Romboutsia lituseburensis DSM 797 TaxID=1121325 RepID=A0A1G9L046_9FIRM|nr:hypothetical protein [Romboutsia lituseburensis]CEH35100.1 Hypothetical protein RLITU_2521 [Romboutsia lituseburensis]SDL55490.1 hypothetical protein SAMN04515677_102335 [Romboutsia lituseburensis DSM 797]